MTMSIRKKLRTYNSESGPELKQKVSSPRFGTLLHSSLWRSEKKIVVVESSEFVEYPVFYEIFHAFTINVIHRKANHVEHR